MPYLDDVNIDQMDMSRSEKRKVTSNRKKEAERIRTLWMNTATGMRTKWQNDEQMAYDFALNSQLTKDEVDALEDAGMPTFTINRITPIIETMKYFVTARNPGYKAAGVGGEDVDMANVHTGVLDYGWNLSGGKSLLSSIVSNALMKSKGYFHIYVDPDDDRGMGEVKIEHVEPFHVYVSSRSCDFMERDASYQIIKKDLPREVLLNMLPQYADKINKASGDQDSMYLSNRDTEDVMSSIQLDDMEDSYKKDGSEDDLLPYYECYEPMRVKYYNLFVKQEPSTSDLSMAKKAIDDSINQFANELQVQFLEKERSLRNAVESGEIIRQRYELEMQKAQQMMQQAVKEKRTLLYNKVRDDASKIEQSIVSESEYNDILQTPVKEDIVNAIPYFEKRVKRTCVVGDQFLYSVMLNINTSPLIPLPYLHTGSPCPMSAVRPLIGKQREINKAHQIMIHNANLSSNLRWLVAEGEIDEDDWRDYASSPGAILKYRVGVSDRGPREIMPQNINNAFFTIEQDSKSDMEYISGIQPPSMGISSGSGDETYRGFLARDEYGTRRIRSWVSNVLEPVLEQVGKVYQQMAQDTYTIHKIFRIVQPNPNGSFDQKELEINVPIYDDLGEEIGRYNDYASSKYDIRIIPGSTLPLNRWAINEENKELFKLGILDDMSFVRDSDIKDKDALLERKSLYKQMDSAIKSKDDEIKQLRGDIDTLRRQIIQVGIKDEIRNAQIEIDRSRTESKMIEKLTNERTRDSLKTAREEMAMEINKQTQSDKSKENKNK